MRFKASTLAIASALVALTSIVGGHATPDWWETIPLIPFTVGAGVLAAAAVYVRAENLLVALPVGVALSAVTYFATFITSCSQWCR
jgi:hypothetical protein